MYIYIYINICSYSCPIYVAIAAQLAETFGANPWVHWLKQCLQSSIFFSKFEFFSPCTTAASVPIIMRIE